MINFPASFFTWTTHPNNPDPVYKYLGGFVGDPGQVYRVRFNLESKCEIHDPGSGRRTDVFLGAPCRSEYTIAKRSLFQIPSTEWRMPFSREHHLALATRPSWEDEPCSRSKLSERWPEHRLALRDFADARTLTDVESAIEATLANDMLGAQTTYTDADTGLIVTLEYPVHVMNLNVDDGEFQVCTGPIALPDLKTWDGTDVVRVFQAEVAISSFDWVEFILQREVEAAEEEKEWLDAVRGLDRLELHDPENPPPGYPPPRPKPLVYNETWEFPARNILLAAKNPA